MALDKIPVNINFAQGLETKTDPYQVQVGKFLTLTNSVFTTAGRLSKRNGFSRITTLPVETQTTLTTLNGNLLATGRDLYAFSADTDEWFDKGSILPVDLSVLPLTRISTSQSAPDSKVASNGLVCSVNIDSGAAYYQISDSATGQQIVGRTAIPNGVAAPRVFIVGRYFVVTYIATVSAVNHLKYLAIPVADPTATPTIQDISSTLTSASAGYDGYTANNNLYIAWSDTGSVVKVTYLSSTLVLQAPTNILTSTATLVSVTADISASVPVIWVSFWDSGSTNGYAIAFDPILNTVLPKTQIITGEVLNALTSVANNGVLEFLYEINNTYASPYPTGGVRTDYVEKNTITQAGVVGSLVVILRSVGLASKAFIGLEDTVYTIVAYGEVNQPSYFLIDDTGAIYMRLAYANGGGYTNQQTLPSISSLDGTYYVSYLIKDFLTTVNKGTNNPAGTPSNAIYTQTGVNLAKFTINTSPQYSSEIASALHLTGGQLWLYDDVKPVEDGFQVWPENVASATSGSGGNIGAGTYYYQFTYEWTDNQGNLHRSAPSIPVVQVTTGTTSTNTLYVPTLRLTYKTSPNPVRIVGYRWSVAQQVYYQFTSVPVPIVNDPSVDFVVITDTSSDARILGTAILYTTGGVIENIAPPASVASTLFKNRLFLVDAEDRNLLWFSKQVIENTPVEMSDLLTFYVAPTSGAQGSTGPVTALSAMDDKLIIFKRDAIYYVTGTGPDNTGANNDFSEPIFVTSSVGCANPNSIVLMPQGVMFQSDKGIWLLGRDLSTVYIGAPVEQFNSYVVSSAQAIPGTNQVRFVISNNLMLMYDYYYQQWGTFTNLFGISSTLFGGMHTYLNSFGQVYQEVVGSYVDGSQPVLMNFTTAWINIAGLQGFERFYFMYLLGTYYSPFKLNTQIAYNYNPNNFQNVTVTPDNASAPWGGEALWGSGSTWGGGMNSGSSSDTSGNVFTARIFPAQQKCMSFQISIQEVFDASIGQSPGQGLTLSGLDLIVGAKKGYRTQRSSQSFG